MKKRTVCNGLRDRAKKPSLPQTEREKYAANHGNDACSGDFKTCGCQEFKPADMCPHCTLPWIYHNTNGDCPNKEMMAAHPDSGRLEWLMKRISRAAKTLSDLSLISNLNPSTKRLIQTLSEAINQPNRDAVDDAIELEELQSNPPLMNHHQHDGH